MVDLPSFCCIVQHLKFPYTVRKRLLAKKPRKEEEPRFLYGTYEYCSSSFRGFLARSRFPTVYGSFQCKRTVVVSMIDLISGKLLCQNSYFRESHNNNYKKDCVFFHLQWLHLVLTTFSPPHKKHRFSTSYAFELHERSSI